MVSVNPPPIPRIPKDWFKDPNIRAYLTAINQIIFQLWLKSGAGTIDEDEDATEDFSYLLAQLKQKTNLDIPDISFLQSQNNQLKREIEELKVCQGNTFQSQINKLKKEIETLKADEPIFLQHHISKRFEDIEAQL